MNNLSSCHLWHRKPRLDETLQRQQIFFSLFLKPNWASGSKVFLVYDFCKWIYQSGSGWHIKIMIKFKIKMLPLIFTCMTHGWIYSHMTATAVHLLPATQAFFFLQGPDLGHKDLYTKRRGKWRGSLLKHSSLWEKKNKPWVLNSVSLFAWMNSCKIY